MCIKLFPIVYSLNFIPFPLCCVGPSLRLRIWTAGLHVGVFIQSYFSHCVSPGSQTSACRPPTSTVRARVA